ncbi:hypothetical protein PBT90_18530 [Algoriphagus halophytocola]|uniref:Uncharacterized protein n=1 Tax=Algoriphagus halophytocola TaxID=2991499 RepID=A0ABY6MDP3_9BACT|nr:MULTISPECIES: hypothetical protein [unclassified Algoriphagus]UZD21514.1 hypothetical protein OM944_12660 [Algoriphagus sp. TR-M5]WBL42726.1 hypothetical protein PBT90_18530 [Algoriphagus sp. TR-M9]
MKKELSSSESLAIITDMIAKAKQEAAGDGSFYFLLWGWVISICSFGHYALEKAGFEHPYYVWVLVLPSVFISFFWGIKKKSKAKIKTHLDQVLNQLWIGVFMGIVVVLGFMPVLGFNHNPVILLLAAVGMFATGSLIRVSMVKLGAVVLAIAAVVAFLVPVSDQYLVAGIAMILGYLVPGYYLKNTYRERV